MKKFKIVPYTAIADGNIKYKLYIRIGWWIFGWWEPVALGYNKEELLDEAKHLSEKDHKFEL